MEDPLNLRNKDPHERYHMDIKDEAEMNRIINGSNLSEEETQFLFYKFYDATEEHYSNMMKGENQYDRQGFDDIAHKKKCDFTESKIIGLFDLALEKFKAERLREMFDLPNPVGYEKIHGGFYNAWNSILENKNIYTSPRLLVHMADIDFWNEEELKWLMYETNYFDVLESALQSAKRKKIAYADEIAFLGATRLSKTDNSKLYFPLHTREQMMSFGNKLFTEENLDHNILSKYADQLPESIKIKL